MNKALSARPKVLPNTAENLEMQKHIDVLSLYAAKSTKVEARMDAEDRLAYIRDCK